MKAYGGVVNVHDVIASIKHIVRDMINTLPGSRSINTVQHATIDEAVFYVLRAEQR
jgi:hypothetical protein